MGLVNAGVLLSSPRLPELEAFEADVLAGTGATHLCIPEHAQIQLRLEVLEWRAITLADGSSQSVPYLVVIPRSRAIDVNPASFNLARSIAKQAAPSL